MDRSVRVVDYTLDYYLCYPSPMIEFNPGHLDSLRKLGILEANETAISPQELAERIAHSDRLNQVISDIRQEALNIAMAFDVTCQNIDELAVVMPSLTTREAIEQELEGLDEAVRQVVLLAERLIQIDDFVKLFRQLNDQSGIILPDEIDQHLAIIGQTVDALPHNIAATARDKLIQGTDLIEQLIKKLGEFKT